MPIALRISFRNMSNAISEPTYRAIAHVREAFAETRGVTRNAIDQMIAGNTKDFYIPFREHFRDVCATDGARPEYYLDDLQSILQKFRPAKCKTVAECALEEMRKAHELIEKYTNAAQDGLDKYECSDLITAVSKVESAAANLKASLINERNVLTGAPVTARNGNGRR
jgi:hypothetical protein